MTNKLAALSISFRNEVQCLSQRRLCEIKGIGGLLETKYLQCHQEKIFLGTILGYRAELTFSFPPKIEASQLNLVTSLNVPTLFWWSRIGYSNFVSLENTTAEGKLIWIGESININYKAYNIGNT